MTAYMPDGRPAPAVMTAEDVVQYLRMDAKKQIKQAVYRLRKKYGLKAFKRGTQVRYRLVDVMAFAEMHVTESAR